MNFYISLLITYKMSNPLIGTTLASIDAVALLATIVYFQKRIASLEERLKKHEEGFETHSKQVKTTFVNVGKDIDHCKHVVSQHQDLNKKVKKLTRSLSQRSCELQIEEPKRNYKPTKESPRKESSSGYKDVNINSKDCDSKVDHVKSTKQAVTGDCRSSPAKHKKRPPSSKKSSYNRGSSSDSESECNSGSESEDEPMPVSKHENTKYSSSKQPPSIKTDTDVSAVIAAASARKQQQ